MKRLSVIYDASCGMCRRWKDWLAREPAFVEFEFVPLQDGTLEKRFPGVGRLHPEREIVVIGDTGEVYQGAKAWVLCLWALKNYREWAERLANPLLLPLAKKVCAVVSSRRQALSRWFFEAPPEGVSAQLKGVPEQDCETGARGGREAGASAGAGDDPRGGAHGDRPGDGRGAGFRAVERGGFAGAAGGCEASGS